MSQLLLTDRFKETFNALAKQLSDSMIIFFSYVSHFKMTCGNNEVVTSPLGKAAQGVRAAMMVAKRRRRGNKGTVTK